MQWSPAGDIYAVVCGSKVTIQSASDGDFNREFTHETSPIHDLAFITVCLHLFRANTPSLPMLTLVWQNDVVVTGSEKGKIRCWNVKNGNLLYDLEAHATRIRGIACITLKKVEYNIDSEKPVRILHRILFFVQENNTRLLLCKLHGGAVYMKSDVKGKDDEEIPGEVCHFVVSAATDGYIRGKCSSHYLLCANL